jgi:PAS domain S-box-containing protein
MTQPAEKLIPLILDGINEGVLAVDADFRITYLNARTEQITGIRRSEALGRRCYEVLRGNICQSGCAMRRSIQTGEPQRDVRVDILDASMERVPLLVSTSALRGPDGEELGGVEILRDISELEALRSELAGRRGFRDIVGVSEAMQRIFALLPELAQTDTAVLIEGESGTGKELIASALHDLSPRRDGPFVQVNCGALPDTLLESELFGYVRGAFTDARSDKPGRFQQADGGTLFLDEVGDLSPAFQVKLLRALQEGEVQPLGAVKSERVDVRVISATHRDLGALVRDGRFREDLYYRLRVLPVTVPPLRERPRDLRPLVDHYVARLAARTGRPIHELSPSATHRLWRCDSHRLRRSGVRRLVGMASRPRT